MALNLCTHYKINLMICKLRTRTKMQNAATRFKIWSSKHNIWIYLIVLLLLGIYALHKITTTDVLARIDAVLLYDKTVQAKISTSKRSNELLINTTGCQLDSVIPFDDRYPEIAKYYMKEEPLECITDKPPLSSMNDGILHINAEILNRYYHDVSQCTYKPFSRDPKDANWVVFDEERTLLLDEENPIAYEFIVVYCKSTNGDLLYRDVHKQIIPKTNLNGKPFPKKGPDEMNVALIILESTSRLNWIRQCPEVHEYITNSLGGIVFNGMNKLADNTSPNLYAMATGKDVATDWKKLLFSAVDNLGWIWKDAEKEGYVSLLSEEVTKIKRPTWTKDFKHEPAVHVHRPMRVLMAGEHAVPKGGLEDMEFCYGSRSQLGLVLDWILDFHAKYKDKKTFAAMSFDHVIGSHTDLNALSSKQHIFMDFFKKLKETSILDDTFIIVVGDHGFRIGEYFSTTAGEYEARLPLLYTIPPKLLKEKHPKSYDNLVNNAKYRLVSPLDIWKTMKSIINNNIQPNPPRENSSPGLSFFSPIPEERTCKQAGIPEHWCACGSYVEIPHNDPRARKVGEILIQSINKITSLEEDLCIKYSDFVISDARIKLPSNDILVVIQTRPVIANFRASISIGTTNPVITNIERLDKYAGVVKCLANTTHREELLPLTCICKDAV